MIVYAGWWDSNDHFVVDSTLTQQLKLEFVKAPYWGKRTYQFLFIIPPGLREPRIYLGAEWDHQILGTIGCMSHPVIDVVPPRTAADSNVVGDSYVKLLNDIVDEARVIAVTESLVACGYRGATGLRTAQNVAERMGEWDMAVRFLDMNYFANGKAALQFATDSMNVNGVFIEYIHEHSRLLRHQPETRFRPARIIY